VESVAGGSLRLNAPGPVAVVGADTQDAAS
jgi:hypothetical protein